MSIIRLGKFDLDLDRFNQLVLQGNEFKTTHYSAEVVVRDGFYTVSQKKNYRLNEDFILQNLDMLLEKKVIKIKKAKNITTELK